MRLREEASAINPVPRNARKRKSPPSVNPTEQHPPQQQQQLPPQPMLHHLPPPHAMIHPMQGGPLPPHYPYADYSPGGLPPTPPQPSQDPSQQSSSSTAAGRALSSSKRAEQNRKAQRAFRERRDQSVGHKISFHLLISSLLSDMSKHSSRDPSSWMPPSHLQMRPTGVGKKVVPWLTNYVSRMLLSALPSARLLSYLLVSLSLQSPHHQLILPATALA